MEGMRFKSLLDISNFQCFQVEPDPLDVLLGLSKGRFPRCADMRTRASYHRITGIVTTRSHHQYSGARL